MKSVVVVWGFAQSPCVETLASAAASARLSLPPKPMSLLLLQWPESGTPSTRSISPPPPLHLHNLSAPRSASPLYGNLHRNLAL